jgi:hypothetical protein
LEILKGRDYFEDIDVDVRVILKRILGKADERLYNGVM